MKSPRAIAVVVACYNLGRTVEEAVGSVLTQTRPATEVVVVDDGSSDVANRQVLLRMRYPRTRVHMLPHAGVAATRNRGVGLTNAPYIVLLDADDVLAPTYLEKAAARLDADESAAFVSCAVQAFEGGSYVWSPPSATRLRSLTHGSVHASTMFRRALWDTVGGFDPDLPAYEDLDFWLRAQAAGFRGEILDEPLLFYRVRDDSRYRRGIESKAYETAMRAIVAKQQDLLDAQGIDVLRSKEDFLLQILDYQQTLTRTQQALEAEAAALGEEMEKVRGILVQRGRADAGCGDADNHVAGPPVTWLESAPGRSFDQFVYARRWMLRGRVAVACDSGHVLPSIRAHRWDAGVPTAVEESIGLEALESLAPGSLDGIILLALEDPFRLEQRLRAAVRALKPGASLLVGVALAGPGWFLEGKGEPVLRDIMARILPLDAFEVASFVGDAVLLTATARKPGNGGHPRTHWHRPSGPATEPNGGLILVYHRVAALSPDTHHLCVPPDSFRQQVRYLAEHCTPLSLDDLLWASREGALPPRAVAVTLDDGYLDALSAAAPILVENGVPATFFVNTEALDEEHEAWHDTVERVLLTGAALPPVLMLTIDGERLERPVTTPELRAQALCALHGSLMSMCHEARADTIAELVAWSGLKLGPRRERRVLLGDEVRALSSMPGCAVGSHSAHHLCLPGQPIEVARAELLDCKRRLEELLDRPVLSFSYPFGEHDSAVAEAVRDTPHLLAVTVEPGLVLCSTDPMLLPRLEVTGCALPHFAWTVERTFGVQRLAVDEGHRAFAPAMPPPSTSGPVRIQPSSPGADGANSRRGPTSSCGRWREITAAEYGTLFTAFGGSFAVHPRVVALLETLSGRSIEYFGCEIRGRLGAGAPVIDGQIVAAYPAVDRLGLSRHIDVGHGEVVLPIADGVTIELPFRGDWLSSLHRGSIANLCEEREHHLMLARSHQYRAPRISSRMLHQRRRLLRRLLEVGGSYRPLREMAPEEIFRDYIALYESRWGSPEPQGKDTLPQVLETLHDLLSGFAVFHRDRCIAINIAYAVETPRNLLAVEVNGGFDPDFARYRPGSAVLYLNTQALDLRAQRHDKKMRCCFGLDDNEYKQHWCYSVPLYSTMVPRPL